MVKTVSIVAGTESTRLAIFNQINSLLGEYIHIDSYSLYEGIDGIIKSDLIIISTKLIVEECKEFLDENCPTIIARRSLDISNIDELFSIPVNSHILLVNDAIETAVETIELLNNLGINHLNYIPHYPGCEIKDGYTMAITPGESRLVPSYVKKVFDLGPRLIDLTTIVEILEKLNILDEKANIVSAKYSKTIIDLSKQLYGLNKESNELNEYLLKVLNQVNDGMIVYDNKNNVTVFNEKSELIFKVHKSKILGKNIDQLTKDKNLLEYLLDDSNWEEEIFKFNNKDIIVNKFHVDKLNSTVCTIADAEKTLNMDIKLRRILFKKGHISKYKFEDIIGESEIIKSTILIAKKLSKTDLSILIHGETGTGKELFAGAIHNYSERSNGPYLAVNFSAISEDLIETELFGYEEGAFTGARKGGKIGLFEQANNGTIFLDEIGDTSLPIQARLLRVLQEKEIMRVGGTDIIPVNVRIITATNRDLVLMCKEGKFREDLYYRIKQLYIKTPTLRQRKEDLEILINHFIRNANKEDYSISEEVLEIINYYDWPGNVRELINLIDYMVVVSDSKTIQVKDIPEDFFDKSSIGIVNNEKEGIYNLLKTKGNPADFHFILEKIYHYNKNNLTVGRKTLSEQSEQDYCFISEEQIRHRCNILEELGLISKSKGPVGMRLTVKGKLYLHYIK